MPFLRAGTADLELAGNPGTAVELTAGSAPLTGVAAPQPDPGQPQAGDAPVKHPLKPAARESYLQDLSIALVLLLGIAGLFWVRRHAAEL